MKKKILFILMLLVAFIPVVSAKVVEADDKLKLTGEYDSTKVIFGNDVNIDADIDGIGMMFGNSLTTMSNVEYGVYFGNQIHIGDEVEKDLFVFGNLVTINGDAVITRDGFIFANTLTLQTNVGRDIHIYASKVNLSGVTILGNATIYAEEIVFDETTNVMGTLKYYDDTKLIGMNKGNMGNLETVEHKEAVVTTSELVKKWFINLGMNVITLFVILLVFPKIKGTLNDFTVGADKVILTGAIGLFALVLVPIVSFFALICEFTMPLSLILLALYFMAMYVGWLYASYVIGRKVWSLCKQKENMFIEGILGLFVTELLALIPSLGGVLAFLLFVFGIGLFLYQFKKISFMEKK